MISERGAPAYRGCGLASAFWRRSAPPIKRMERTSIEASKLAPPSAAHPQPRYAYLKKDENYEMYRHRNIR